MIETARLKDHESTACIVIDVALIYWMRGLRTKTTRQPIPMRSTIRASPVVRVSHKSCCRVVAVQGTNHGCMLGHDVMVSHLSF